MHTQLSSFNGATWYPSTGFIPSFFHDTKVDFYERALFLHFNWLRRVYELCSNTPLNFCPYIYRIFWHQNYQNFRLFFRYKFTEKLMSVILMILEMNYGWFGNFATGFLKGKHV